MKKILVLMLFFGAFLFFSAPSASALEDRDYPEVTFFSVSPNHISTADDPQEITVTIGLKDDLTGVDPNSQVWFTPLIGTQRVAVNFDETTRISGDDMDGMYTATITVPRWSKVGIWTPSIFVSDMIGNTEWIDLDQLSNMFPNSDDLYFANTAAETRVEIEREWSFSSASATAVFPEGTVVTNSDGGDFEFYKMVNQEFSIDNVSVTKSLVGEPLYVLRIGVPGLGLSFSHNVTINLNVGTKYKLKNLIIQSLDEGDGAWANETSCRVDISGVCTFTVDHASYFAATVAPVNKIITGPGDGGGPQIQKFRQDGYRLDSSFFAFNESFRGGVHVAAGDVDGDGTDEIIVGIGPGEEPWVKVYENDGTPVSAFLAYGRNIRGGVYVAAGDLDGDGDDEVITGVPEGFGPHVRVFNGVTGEPTITAGFFAYAENVRTGIRVAAGDLDGDGTDEIVTGTGFGGGTHIRTFTGTGEAIFTPGFFVYGESDRTGINVTTGSLYGGNKDYIITGSGKGRAPEVRVYDRYGNLRESFAPYGSFYTLGVKVAAGDVDGDAIDEIVTGTSFGGGPQVRIFETDGTFIKDFFAYGETFRGGVDVAVGYLGDSGAR